MLLEIFFLAQREIRRNAMRSSLTILGIVIGVAAVITLVTLGGGATEQVTADIQKLGTNLLQVRPGQDRHGPAGSRATAERFTEDDAEAIAREVSGLAAVAPVAFGGTQAIYRNRNWATSIHGSTNDYLTARNWSLKSGRRFTRGEMRAGKTVCIIGGTVRRELFGSEDPLGRVIRLRKKAFTVVGEFESKGMSGFGSDQDDFVLMPLRTYQRRVVGDTAVDAVYVSAADGASTTKVKEDLERLMRERRRITPGKEDNFHVRDMEEIVSTMTTTTRVLTALLGAVAAVSLLVGGIGIMNIMLVSVTERTREIGIRLAIGAREGEVLLQFLVEAVVLSSFGGLIGVGLGLSVAGAGARLLGVPFILNPGIVALAFFFSGMVGVIFGYFPARKAARLNPIDALRYE